MLALAVATVALSVAASAHASLLSVVVGLVSPNKASALNNNVNSQTVALLGSLVGNEPADTKLTGDTTIVAGALLSDSGPSGTIANVEEYRQSDQISVYVVREGDSLSQIAKMFGVSANTIIWANDLPKGGAIRPGQVLTILPITGVKHLVKKGDTIGTIAKKYGGDASGIAAFNGLDQDVVLAVGQIVIVPDGEIDTPVVKPKPASGGTGGGSVEPNYDGYYLRPIAGGKRSQGLHGHNGIDFAAPVGTPILASADGVVIISKEGGWNGGYGNYVVIRHNNGTQTLYAHNSKNLVSSGEQVTRGETIGQVGTTGKVTGAHVHFEVRGARNPFQ
ncbi:MAG: M23 family metallopeptidase [bacterium]|nr:M23 family metallopeptidase [bacterium]